MLLFSFFLPHSKYMVNYVRKMRYLTLLLCNTFGCIIGRAVWHGPLGSCFLQLDDSKNLLIKTLSFHMIVLGVVDFKQNDFFPCEICGNFVTEGINTLKATFCKPIFVSLQNLMCV